MALQLSVAVRNARLDAIETAIAADAGTVNVLEIRTGAQPANCATADSGTLLVSISLTDDDFMDAAASGSKALTGTYSAAATGAGTAGHFRIKSAAGTCHIQGTVTLTGGGGDMTVDNTNIAVSQNVTIQSFVLTDGNA